MRRGYFDREDLSSKGKLILKPALTHTTESVPFMTPILEMG